MRVDERYPGHWISGYRDPAAIEAARFTERHPIGTPVRYWPGLRKGEGRASTIRSRAWVMGGGHVVVKVDGYPGGISLTHVEVVASDD